jgi:hypothetical protein
MRIPQDTTGIILIRQIFYQGIWMTVSFNYIDPGPTLNVQQL